MPGLTWPTNSSPQAVRLAGSKIEGESTSPFSGILEVYAEYTKVPAKDCQHLPEELPLEESSIIADAISTPYHAVKNRAQVRPGDSVVVFGCGGVGINVVQMAAASGGSVIAVDLVDKKLEIAKQLGALRQIGVMN